MQKIQISNTLTGKKEELTPIEEGHVKIYACGVTTYDHCHIGHAMQAIYFDMVRSYLEYAGYQVTYVRNYTDVDDKIIKKADELGIDPLTLSQDMIRSSQEDMASIGVRPASFEPKVSENIPEIQDMIKNLIQSEYAYPTDSGDVYYRVTKKKDYGKLSNRNIDDLIANTRGEASNEKEHPLDFALWKKDTTEGASWESPWGPGRPGWHIECSAMSKRYLGDQFDIHGGGRDLVFPHHENEIAQSEAANCCNYATIWMHSGLLTINKQKMSKSLGNHIGIKDFVSQYPGEVLRLAYLQFHYSSNVDFGDSIFINCLRRLLYYYETIGELETIAAKAQATGTYLDNHNPDELIPQFHKEMSNDFSTVCALRDLLQGVKKSRELLTAKKSPQKAYTAAAYARVFRELFGVFGLLQQDSDEFIENLKDKILPSLNLTRDVIDNKITERNTARKDKDFAKSDAIRDELIDMGIEIQDTPGGTRWTVKLGD
ncbi:MAG: cysteine--tRNA ligase [Pseudobacteriovorax sp.]|nr:cysteine--tRNA ligase [Pseudobacteriovorax sp.]